MSNGDLISCHESKTEYKTYNAVLSANQMLDELKFELENHSAI